MMAAQTERNNAKRSHRENTKLHNNNNKKRRRRRHDFARDLTLYLKGKTFLFFFLFFLFLYFFGFRYSIKLCWMLPTVKYKPLEDDDDDEHYDYSKSRLIADSSQGNGSLS